MSYDLFPENYCRECGLDRELECHCEDLKSFYELQENFKQSHEALEETEKKNRRPIDY